MTNAKTVAKLIKAKLITKYKPNAQGQLDGAHQSMCIPRNLLKIDEDYQRSLYDATVDNIAQDGVFDPLAYRPLTVSLRDDGNYYIIDGNHRFEIFSLKYRIEFRCEVYVGLSQSQEAALFEKLNRVRLVNSGAKFRAMLCRGEEHAVKINDIVSGAGFQIKLGRGKPPAGTPNVLKNITGLQVVFNSFGGESTLRGVLTVLKRAFQQKNANGDPTGNVQNEAQKDLFIRGIACYLYTCKGNVEDAIKVLSQQDAATWKKALSEVNAAAVRKDGATSLAQMIVDTLENNNRLSPPTVLKKAA